MMRVKKRQDILIRACRLGDGSPLERELLESGGLRISPNGYEVFSQEAQNGAGEVAQPGDYVKIDSAGVPYPNDRAFFEAGHIHVEGEFYRQITKPLNAWQAGDEPCEVIDFLRGTGRLVINENDPGRYFSAFLWGAPLSAARDAVVVFYTVKRDPDGNIQDVNFNFVERKEFERTYEVLGD